MKGLPLLPKQLPFRFEFWKRKLFSSFAHLIVFTANPFGLVALRFGLSKGKNNLDERGNFEVVTLPCKHF